MAEAAGQGDGFSWQPARPNISWWAFLGSWIASAISLNVAAAILPGVQLYRGVLWSFVIVAVIAALNAFLAPLVAALRLPFSVALDFVFSLVLSALLLQFAASALPGVIRIDTLGWAFAAALVISAVHTVIAVVLGINDDDGWALRTTSRIARRSGDVTRSDAPGLILLEIDGLAYPILQRAMRDGSAPHMAAWLQEGSHVLTEWETDLSSQTGASQAGILLGSNHDIPAFRWATCSPAGPIAASSPSAASTPRRRPTRATAASSRASRTPRRCSCCSAGRSCSSSWRRPASGAATCARAATAAASTRSSAARSA